MPKKTQKIKNLPKSSDEFWDGSEKEMSNVGESGVPNKWIRKGMYAVSLNTPYELSIALDWEIYDIIDGIIVRKGNMVE